MLLSSELKKRDDEELTLGEANLDCCEASCEKRRKALVLKDIISNQIL
jgi:hypothetical protein